MKKIALIFGFLLAVSGVSAQAVTDDFWRDPISHPLFPLYALSILVLVVIVLVAIVAFYLLRVLNLLIEKGAREQAEKAGLVYVPRPSWIAQLQQKLTRSTPVEKEETILLDHDYDGIKELDNHLPPWWKWLFYGTIVWAGIYLVVYHITDSLPLSADEYQAQVAEIEKIRASQPVAAMDEEAIEFTNDPALIENGKKVFEANCASCHRADGGGDIGPNLTDEYWLYGGSAKHIYATIKNGKPENGMISWSPILKPEAMRDAAFYILSLRGSSPSAPKAPQGELFVPAEKGQDGQKADSVLVEASL